MLKSNNYFSSTSIEYDTDEEDAENETQKDLVYEQYFNNLCEVGLILSKIEIYLKLKSHFLFRTHSIRLLN